MPGTPRTDPYVSTLPHTAPTSGRTPDARACKPALHQSVRSITPFRLGVRGVAVSLVFPLVGPLPSTNSADSSSLFARFIGTMGPSDSPTLYTPVLRTYLHRPFRPPSRADGAGVSRFSSMKLHVRRVPVTPPGPTATRLLRRSRFCHPLGTTKAAPGNRFFRSSIARLALLCQRFASLLPGLDA